MDENGIQSFALGILFVSPFFGFRIQWMSDANSGFMFLRLSKKHYELSSQEIEVSVIKLPQYLIPTLLLLIFWDRFGSGVAAGDGCQCCKRVDTFLGILFHITTATVPGE